MGLTTFRNIVLSVALIVTSGCDLVDYEDSRLTQLKIGVSTEQDVRKLFGTPSAVRDIAGGKGLVYPLGPDNPYTLLIRITPDGKYQGRENLLTRENFQRVNGGMSRVAVLVLLGRPTATHHDKEKRQTVWEWQFKDGRRTRWFAVTFDAAGLVANTKVEDDKRRSR